MERRESSTNWIPKVAEVWDATGNHWRPFFDKRYSRTDGKSQFTGFFGALWPGEDAWKLKVSFDKQNAFSTNELIRFDSLSIPTGTTVQNINLVREQFGTRLELLALLGPDTKHQSVESLNPNIWPVSGRITAVFKGTVLEQERSLHFVKAMDDRGTNLELSVEMHAPGELRSESHIPYIIDFEIASSVKSISLILALPKIRTLKIR